MTLHNAKGLEYPIVFIAGCEDGVFPHSRALDEGGLEEERRLFYVGVTRAKRELYLTYARRRSVFGQTYGLRSRFLDEIPAELTDREEEMRSVAGAAVSRVPARADARSAVRSRPGLGGLAWAGEALPRRPSHGRGRRTRGLRRGRRHGRGAGRGDRRALRRDGSERKLMAEYAPVPAAEEPIGELRDEYDPAP